MTDFIKVLVRPLQEKQVRVREGETNGRKWRMVDQKVWIFLDDEFPTEFVLSLPQDSLSIQVGEYHLTLDSFRAALGRGKYDGLTLNTQDLILFPVDFSETSQKPPGSSFMNKPKK